MRITTDMAARIEDICKQLVKLSYEVQDLRTTMDGQPTDADDTEPPHQLMEAAWDINSAVNVLNHFLHSSRRLDTFKVVDGGPR